jgi:hypothetical protein
MPPPSMTIFSDQYFMLFCMWLSFLDIVIIAICLPLIVWKLYFGNERREIEQFREKQKLSRIEDNIEKLQSELQKISGRDNQR